MVRGWSNKCKALLLCDYAGQGICSGQVSIPSWWCPCLLLQAMQYAHMMKGHQRILPIKQYGLTWDTGSSHCRPDPCLLLHVGLQLLLCLALQQVRCVACGVTGCLLNSRVLWHLHAEDAQR